MVRRGNQQKHSDRNRYIVRRGPTRERYDRILIVCEGEKTEPNYFKEIKRKYRTFTAKVKILPSGVGTLPLHIVQYAERIFKNGNPHTGIGKRAFDQVYIVFDRDEHPQFVDALSKSSSLDKKIKNDEGKLIRFWAIPSNPCFEFWILLHFENVQELLGSNVVGSKLTGHYPIYSKTATDVFKTTEQHLALAKTRASALASNQSSNNGPYTRVGELVDIIENIKK